MNELVTETPDLAANDLVMAKQMAETLHSHYPGHAWAVTCDGATGIATVRNLALSGNWGFTLKLTTTYSASEFRRRIVMAGGELLERYRLTRGRFDEETYRGLARNFAGNLKADT